MFGENAVLTEIHTASQADDGTGYGDPSDQGTLVWSGRVPCTIRRKRLLTEVGGLATLIEQDEVIVRADKLSTYGFGNIFPGGRTSGCTILVEDKRAAGLGEHRYTVHSAQLRAGATPGQSLSMILGDGAD